MAGESTKYTISQDDIKQLGSKLDTFAQGLSDQERDVLSWIVARAAAEAEHDASGYVFSGPQLTQFGTPLSSQLGRAVGFEGLGGIRSAVEVETTVRWSK